MPGHQLCLGGGQIADLGSLQLKAACDPVTLRGQVRSEMAPLRLNGRHFVRCVCLQLGSYRGAPGLLGSQEVL